MFFHRRRPWDPVGGTETPEPVAMHRRRWLQAAGMTVTTGIVAGAGYVGYRSWRGTDQEVVARGTVPIPPAAGVTRIYPATRDSRFEYGRAETDPLAAARHTNFYEFSRYKWVWKHVDAFQPEPWTISIEGLCRNPRKVNLEDLFREFASDFSERQYRHRCVETWAMTIPWTGFPLAKLLQAAEPLASATHVRFTTFFRPDEAPHQRGTVEYPWPYVEGLTLPEAMHDLSLLATGMYGKPLLKQHGAPVRLVVPWKYGYKSIKSIERIEFVDEEPATFWTTLAPDAYPFQSNVDPHVPRPWPQHSETMLGTGERFATQPYNGYGEYVSDLYASG